jgi:translation initiation factor 3 subunit A
LAAQVPGSLEIVCHKFVDLSEAGVTAAAQGKQQQQQQRASGGSDVIDVDGYEALVLAAVSGSSVKERVDAQLVEPSLRFLWEAYRAVLDILKSNAVLESVYHSIVRRAIKFYQVALRTDVRACARA